MQTSTECGACGGTGIYSETRVIPVCCGNGTVHGCCGEPIPEEIHEEGPCPHCTTQEVVSWFKKRFSCCGQTWETEWDSLCTDRCSACGNYRAPEAYCEEAITVEEAARRSSTTTAEYRCWGEVRVSVLGSVKDRPELGDGGWIQYEGGLCDVPPVADDSEVGDDHPHELVFSEEDIVVADDDDGGGVPESSEVPLIFELQAA